MGSEAEGTASGTSPIPAPQAQPEGRALDLTTDEEQPPTPPLKLEPHNQAANHDKVRAHVTYGLLAGRYFDRLLLRRAKELSDGAPCDRPRSRTETIRTAAVAGAAYAGAHAMTKPTTTGSGGDKAFSGSIPRIYDTYLVPLIFEVYARELGDRLIERRPARVLELAAGTGVVTRVMAGRLAPDVSITATDLNQAMLDRAVAVGTARTVTWLQADAMRLPFEAGQFDAVVCQFGAMFFPDKGAAFAEVHRVLRAGGVFLFNVWDRLAANELAATITDALAAVFPEDPPRFMDRIPHGYHEPATIARDLAAGGFAAAPQIDTIPARGRAESARVAAIAYCQGTPVRHEIEARDVVRLEQATDAAEEAVARRFGRGPIDSAIQALVVTAAR